MKFRKKYLLASPPKRFLAGILDWLGYLLSPNRRGKPINKSNIKKMLLIRLDHIGDVLMTTPAIRSLRKEFPEAEIDLLVREATAPVVELNPHLNRVITLNAPWTTPGPEKASWGEVKKLAARLKASHYDCVVGFRSDLREALLIRKIGAPVRVGSGERGGGFCFTHPVALDPGKHEIRRALDLLSPLGVASDGDRMDFAVSHGDRERAGEILNKIPSKRGRTLVGIHPGAASPFKRWTEKGFARLGDLLSGKGYRIIFLGAKCDRELLDRITGLMAAGPTVVSDIELGVLGAMIEKLDLLVGNDSAPAHIARALGTPSLTLYGPTHDEVTGPLDREKHTVVRKPLPCAPCWRPGTKFECRYDLRCWRELTVEEVAEAAVEKLGGSRRL